MSPVCSFLVAAVLAAGVGAVAQQPGPESNGINRNEPQTKIQPNTPTGQQPGPASAAQKPAEVQPPSAPSKGIEQAPTQADAANAQPAPDAAKEPQTVILPAANAPGNADPLLEVPELPKGNPTLVGGTAVKVDRIRNRMVVQPFGGGKKMRVNFDERSHIYRDGRETTVMGLKEGDRVYADTMLVDGRVFARNLRIQSQGGPAEARGQVTQYDARTGQVVITDQLTTQPVRFTVNNRTAIRSGDAPATATDLRPGSLVDVIFLPGRGKSGDAREVSILAQPGAKYVFVGRVTNIDLRSGVLAVDNQTDNKNYELRFDPANTPDRDQLAIGTQILANATFDGHGYRADTITVQTSSAQQ